MNQRTTVGLCFTIIFFVLATAVNLINPAFEAPDEPDHYEFLRHVALYRNLPVQEIGGVPTESHQPPLYYVLGLFLTAPIEDGFQIADPEHNPNWMSYPFGSVHNDNKAAYLPIVTDVFPYEGTSRTVHVMRLWSTVLASAAVALFWQISNLIFPQKREAAVLLTAVIAFNPMFLYIAGSFNNDNGIIFIAALNIWLVARAIQDRYRWQTCVWLGVTWGLALLSKLTGLFLCSAWGVGLIWICVSEENWTDLKAFRWRFFLGRCVLITSIFLAVAGWWLGRNIMLYGEPFALETTITTWGGRAPGEFTADQILAGVQQSWQSFWGRFGSSQIVLHRPFYLFVNTITAVAVVGNIWHLWQNNKRDIDRKRMGYGVVLAIVWPIYFAAQLYFMYRYPPGATGRLTYPALVGFGTLFVFGWLALPQKWHKQIFYTLSVAMLATAVYSIALLQWTYAPPTQQILATDISHQLTWGENNVQLLGTGVNGTAFADGDEIELTACWSSEQAPELDYTFALSVVDGDLNKYAERNTHTGLGNYPTSMWVANEPFCEIYRAPVTAGQIDVPIMATVNISFYERESGNGWPATAPEGYKLDWIALDPVKIIPSEWAIPPEPPNQTQIRFAEGVMLNGYDIGVDDENGSDEQVHVRLWWRASGPLAANYVQFLHVINEQGELIAQVDTPPLTENGSYPTSFWGEGETIITQLVLNISATELAEQQLFVGMYHPADLSRLPLVDPNQGLGDAAELDSSKQ